MKQMAWLSDTPEGTKQLYVKSSPQEPWKPYTALEKTERVPDYQVPKGSAGYATAQALLRKGWVYVSSDSVKLEARLK